MKGWYTYLHAKDRGKDDIPADAKVGWYTWEEVDGEWTFNDWQNEKVTVYAGEAFYVNTANDANIEIPSPLAKTEE